MFDRWKFNYHRLEMLAQYGTFWSPSWFQIVVFTTELLGGKIELIGIISGQCKGCTKLKKISILYFENEVEQLPGDQKKVEPLFKQDHRKKKLMLSGTEMMSIMIKSKKQKTDLTSIMEWPAYNVVNRKN